MIRTPRAARTLALLCACALPTAQADDAVVGSGTLPSCTEAALDVALGQLYPGANFPGGVLSFNCGANPTTIPLTTRKTLTGATVVDGGGLVTLDGQNSTGLFVVVGAQSRIEIRNLTLHRGRAFASHGGAIQVGAGTDVLLADSVIRESLAEGSGGAIHVDANAGLRVERSQFIDNSALHGGAIASNSPLTVLDSSFSDNVTAANGEGGAIQIWFARLDARRTQFVDNRAAQGGALAVRGNGTDYATLIDVSFTGNTANNDGGAVLLYDNAGVTGQRVLASGNQATAGGVFSLRGSVTGVGQPRQIGALAGLLDSRFSGNQASSMGGVAYVFGTSPGVGGSIGEFVLDHCVVVDNTAYEGGAIYSRGQLLLGATQLRTQRCIPRRRAVVEEHLCHRRHRTARLHATARSGVPAEHCEHWRWCDLRHQPHSDLRKCAVRWQQFGPGWRDFPARLHRSDHPRQLHQQPRFDHRRRDLPA